ncbi:MAG: cyclic nucleotide-binding domain-containing protein [Pseudomonadota bacterium]
MTLSAALSVLKTMPLLRVLDERRLRVIVMTGDLLSIRQGERLWEKGDDGDSVIIVLEGQATVLVPPRDGAAANGAHETAVAVLGPGEIIGEMAVLTGSPRSTAIAAQTDLRVLRLDGGIVLDLLHEFPELAIEFIRVLAQRLEATNARVV